MAWLQPLPTFFAAQCHACSAMPDSGLVNFVSTKGGGGVRERRHGAVLKSTLSEELPGMTATASTAGPGREFAPTKSH